MHAICVKRGAHSSLSLSGGERWPAGQYSSLSPNTRLLVARLLLLLEAVVAAVRLAEVPLLASFLALFAVAVADDDDDDDDDDGGGGGGGGGCGW